MPVQPLETTRSAASASDESRGVHFTEPIRGSGKTSADRRDRASLRSATRGASKGDPGAARASFAAARERSSQPLLQAEAWLEEAHALELLGRADQARGAAEAAIGVFPPGEPRRGNAAYLLARLEAARGELGRALEAHA